MSVDFSFFKLKNDSLSFLYSYVGRLAEHADVVAFSHSNRIKRAILMPLTKLDSTLITLQSPMVYAKRNIDSLTKSNAIVSSSTVLKEDSLRKVNNYPSDYYFILGVHGSICKTHLMSGANINLLFQLKKHPRFLVGPTASLFVFGLYSGKFIPPYIKYRIFNYDLGLRMLHQLKGNLFFNLNTQVLLGKEQYVYEYNPYSSYSPGNKSTTTKTENIIGFQLEMGLYFIPVQKQGVYFGMDFFVRGCSSTIFDSNAGFKLNLGIKF